MNPMHKFLLRISLMAALLLLAVAGRAQDVDARNSAVREDGPGDTDQGLAPSGMAEAAPSSLLPQLRPASRYEKIWENSPFELEAAPDVLSTSKESFAKDYALSGMLKEGDKTIVYIINRKTKKTFRVTSEGGGDGGFKLQALEGSSNNVRDVEATIEKDGEVARLTYDKTLLAAPARAALANHPSLQRKRDQTENPRNAAGNAQDRSAEAADARQAGLAARSGSGRTGNESGAMGSQASNGTSAGASSASGAGAAPSSTSRRRIVLPKRVEPPAQ